MQELLDPVTDVVLARFRQQDAIVAQMAAEYLPLRVKDHTDEQGLKAVHAARMLVVKARTTVDAIHDEMKVTIIRDGRAIDAEARRIKSLLAPIESHLKEQEAVVTREKERLKAEAEAKRKAALDARIAKLLAVGVVLNPSLIEVMSDFKFDELLDEATQLKVYKEHAAAEKLANEAAERARLTQEADLQKSELAAQRKQLDEERRKHEAEAAAERSKLKAEQERQWAEQEVERKRQAEEDRIRHAEILQAREALAEEQRKLDAERRAIEIENARREAALEAERKTVERLAKEEEATRLAEEAEQAKREDEELLASIADAEHSRQTNADDLVTHKERILVIAEMLENYVVDAGPLQEAVIEVLGIASDRIYELVQEYR